MISIDTHQLTKQIGKNIVLSNIDLSLVGGNIYGFVGTKMDQVRQCCSELFQAW